MQTSLLVALSHSCSLTEGAVRNNVSTYRQGDVCQITVDAIDGTNPQKRDSKARFVLTFGEATGHAHSIGKKEVTLYGTNLENRFLDGLADGGAALSQKGNARIPVP